jgi:hypothetical protein
MTRLLKAQAQAALRELACIRELSDEARTLQGNSEAHAVLAHRPTVQSMNRHLEVLRLSETPIPAWVANGRKYLKTLGWIIP